MELSFDNAASFSLSVPTVYKLSSTGFFILYRIYVLKINKLANWGLIFHARMEHSIFTDIYIYKLQLPLTTNNSAHFSVAEIPQNIQIS